MRPACFFVVNKDLKVSRVESSGSYTVGNSCFPLYIHTILQKTQSLIDNPPVVWCMERKGTVWWSYSFSLLYCIQCICSRSRSRFRSWFDLIWFDLEISLSDRKDIDILPICYRYVWMACMLRNSALLSINNT